MRKHSLYLLSISLLILLTACGSRPPRLEPPLLKLVDLVVEPDTNTFELRMRLSNAVAASMDIDKITFAVTIDELVLGDFAPPFNGTLPSLGEEVLTVTGAASAELIASLARLNSGAGAMAPLTIEGQAVTRPDSRQFTVSAKGWISATPGRPWSFR